MKRYGMTLLVLVLVIAAGWAQMAEAATYYYDNNSSTAGFGTAGGTWAATTGGPTPGWSTDSGGNAVPVSVTTLTTDILNFGNGATGLGAGTITVSGTPSAGDMTFASGSGAIVLSGGTITMAATETITVDNASDTISSILAGAATSLTKAGAGTLNLSAANTYSGNTIINGGVLQIVNGGATGSLYLPTVTSGNLTFGSAGTITLNNNSSLVYNISGGAVNVNKFISGTGTLNVTGNQGVNFAASTSISTSGSQTYSATATGTRYYGFNLTDSGTVTLTSSAGNISMTGMLGTANGNTGNLVIDTSAGNGSVTLNTAVGVSGVDYGLASLTINAGTGTINIGTYGASAWQSPGVVTLTGGSVNSTASMGSFTSLTINNSSPSTFSGNINVATTGSLTKNGVGALTLSGANTFSGGLTIKAGTVKLGNTTAAGAGTVTIGVAGDATSGTLDLNGASRTIVGLGTAGTAANQTIGNSAGTAATLNYTGATTSTFGGVIQDGPGASTTAVTVNNASANLTLSGTCTYSGATTLSAGTLLVNSPGSLHASSAVTVASGAKLGGNGTINGTVSVSAGGDLAPGASAGAIGTLTLTDSSASALTLNGSGLYFDMPASGACDLIAITGNLVVNGANTISINAPSGIAAGTYTLMSYAAKTGSGSIVFPNGTTTMGNLTLSVDATSVTLSVGTDGFGIWKGTVSGVWDGGILNWTRNGVASQAYVAGDHVRFDDSAGANKTVSSGGTVAPSSVTVDSTAAYTITATIGGSGTPLVKSGSGTLTLTGANTYSGGTTISAGTLQIGNNGTAGTLGSGSVVNNGTLSFHRTDTTTFSGTMTGAGTLAVARGGTLTLASGASVTQANVYAGDGSAATLGAGTFTVQSGASLIVRGNFFLGNQASQNGTLNQTGGTVDLTSSVAVGNSIGDIRIGNWATLTGTYNLSGGTINALNADATLSWDGTGTIAVSGGTANLRGVKFSTNNKTQSGTLNLSGAGTLNIGAGGIYDGSSGANTMNMNFSGGTLGALTAWSSSLGITLTGTTTIDTTGGNITLSGALVSTGAITKTGTGTLTLSGANTFAGGTTVNGGSLAFGAVPGAGAGNIRGTLNINPNATVNAGGSWNLGYASGTSVNTINIDHGNLLFSSTAFNGGTAASTITLTGGTIAGNGGGNTFDWYYGNTTTPSLITVASPDRSTISANLNIRLNNAANNLTFNVGSGTTSDGIDLLVSGIISSTGGADALGGIIKTGAGRMVLSGANTFTGGLTIQAGTVKLSTVATAAGAGTVTLGVAGDATSGILDLNGASRTIIGLATAGTAASQIITSMVTGGILNYTGATTSDFGGVITGSTPSFTVLTVNNASANLTLSGATANTYAGLTTVSAGTLLLGKSGVNAIGGNLTVSGGTARLTGSGGDQIPNSANVVVSSGTFDLNGLNETVNGVQMTGGTISSGVGILTSSTAYDMQAGTASAILGGSAALNKTTAGAVTLSGANTYSGVTAVNSGSLYVNGSLASGSSVTVASGSTLGGSGTINGTVNAASGANLAPGASAGAIGLMTLANTMTLNGAKLYFDLSSDVTPGVTYDQITNTVDLVLNGTNVVYLNAPSVAAAGTYYLMNFASKSGTGSVVFWNGSTRV